MHKYILNWSRGLSFSLPPAAIIKSYVQHLMPVVYHCLLLSIIVHRSYIHIVKAFFLSLWLSVAVVYCCVSLSIVPTYTISMCVVGGCCLRSTRVMCHILYVHHCPSFLHMPYPHVLSSVYARNVSYVIRTSLSIIPTHAIIHVCCRRSPFAVYMRNASYVVRTSLFIVPTHAISMCCCWLSFAVYMCNASYVVSTLMSIIPTHAIYMCCSWSSFVVYMRNA